MREIQKSKMGKLKSWVGGGEDGNGHWYIIRLQTPLSDSCREVIYKTKTLLKKPLLQNFQNSSQTSSSSSPSPSSSSTSAEM
jgi:hypothetical protein